MGILILDKNQMVGRIIMTTVSTSTMTTDILDAANSYQVSFLYEYDVGGGGGNYIGNYNHDANEQYYDDDDHDGDGGDDVDWKL